MARVGCQRSLTKTIEWVKIPEEYEIDGVRLSAVCDFVSYDTKGRVCCSAGGCAVRCTVLLGMALGPTSR